MLNAEARWTIDVSGVIIAAAREMIAAASKKLPCGRGNNQEADSENSCQISYFGQ